MKAGKFVLVVVTAFVIGCNKSELEINLPSDYYEGIYKAKVQNMPLFINFSCFGCIGYNEFERDLTKSKQVRKKLTEEFVAITLYIDDKTAISPSDVEKYENITIGSNQGISTLNFKNKGQLNTFIQKELFGQFYQPMYVIITSNNDILVEPFGYTKRDKEYFLVKLDAGLENFSKITEK